MNIINLLKSIWGGVKDFHSSPTMRTSTRITMYWLIFSAILIVWLVIGIPLLSIFYPQLAPFGSYTANVITALIGGSALSFAASETRKTIENVNSVERTIETKE